MQLEKIRLVNFKNYESGDFDFSAKANLIVGLNGVGKTNLLDSIFYLCMCKSRFAGSDRNVARKTEEGKAEFFRLEGHFKKKKKKEKIVAKVKPGNLKVFETNDVAHEKLADHIGNCPVIMVVPDDAVLILESSESRRALIDIVLSQMERPYLKALMTYNRILKQRNAALKEALEKGRYDASLIRTYNQQLLDPSKIIHELRTDYLVQFNHYLDEFYKAISGEKEVISCTYNSVFNEADIATVLEQNMEKDRHTGRTTAGVHKDDLVFKLDDFPLKRFASQGQLKSFVMAIKLAQYELLRLHKGVTPLLLLDDIFAKLDEERITQLLDLLNGKKFGQVFITDTHAERGAAILDGLGMEYRKFEIAKNKGS